MNGRERRGGKAGGTTRVQAKTRGAISPGRRTLTMGLQRRASAQPGADADPARVQARAAEGVAGPGSPLPHGEEIQQAFGAHDVSRVRAHVGGEAAAAAEDIGARAYATGEDVAFAAAPELHTAAHEAAHVVQQQAGVQLEGGVGAEGDEHERHADAVADAVVAGRSAEPLLSTVSTGNARSRVQRKEADSASNREEGSVGTSGAPPRLELDPRRLSLGSVAVGDLRNSTIHAVNHDDHDVSIASVSVEDGPAFEAQLIDPSELAPGDISLVLITYTPIFEGEERGTLLVETAEGWQLRAALDGIGTISRTAVGGSSHDPGVDTGFVDPANEDIRGPERPALRVSPPPDDLAISVGKSLTRMMTVENTGTDPADLSSIESLGDDPSFRASLRASGSLAAGESAPFELTFAPWSEGDAVATLAVLTRSSAGEPRPGVTFEVRGTGTAPDWSWPPGGEHAPGTGERQVVEGDAGPSSEPAAPARETVEHALSVGTLDVSLTTVAGRASLPDQVLIENPNQAAVAVELAIEGASDEPSAFSTSGSSVLVPGADRGGYAHLGVRFAPGAEGTHEGALVLRYGQHEQRIALHGTALAAPATPEHGDGEAPAPGTDPGPRPASLPDAELPASRDEARAMLAQAADAVASLAPACEARLASTLEATWAIVGDVSGHARGFQAQLLGWLNAEAAKKLGDLKDDNARAFLEYALGMVSGAAGGPKGIGLAITVTSFALDIRDAKVTNATIERSSHDLGFLTALAARSTDRVTELALMEVAAGMHEMGRAEGKMKENAGPDAQQLLKEIGAASAGNRARALELYAAGRKAVDDYRQAEEDLALALRGVAARRNDLVGQFERMLVLMKDAYLDYLALGGKPDKGGLRRLRLRGNVNFDQAEGGAPLTLTLYEDAARWGSEGVAAMSSDTAGHATSKRLSELGGWDIEIELAVAQGGTLILHQSPDGERSDRAAGGAEVDLIARPEAAERSAAVWAALDRASLGRHM